MYELWPNLCELDAFLNEYPATAKLIEIETINIKNVGYIVLLNLLWLLIYKLHSIE